jgi:hypothetical protein
MGCLALPEEAVKLERSPVTSLAGTPKEFPGVLG